MTLRIAISSLLLSAATTAAIASPPALPQTLPARFEAGLIYVEPVTTDGVKLSLFTDTGGGLFLTPAAAEKLGIDYTPLPDGKREGPAGQTPWPSFCTDAWIPQPAGTADGIRIVQMPHYMHLRDGMLGANWFANRCWEFDYPNQSLRQLECGSLPDVGPSTAFRCISRSTTPAITPPHSRASPSRSTANRWTCCSTPARRSPSPTTHWRRSPAASRRRARVASSPRASQHAGASGIRSGAGSTGGERGTGMALVQAANVRVAGYDSGPAWFALRPVANFHEWMSRWMDEQVEGRWVGMYCGGRVTVEYVTRPQERTMH